MDSSLYSSLRQPAFDLIQTIVVADAAALVFLWAKRCNQHISFLKFPSEIDGDDDELLSFNEVEEDDVNCWMDFNMLGRLTSRGCEEWFCIPLLWVDVLSGISPSSLPLPFSKSVLWALSRFSVIEPEISNSITMSESQWVSMYFEKIGTSSKWSVPKGCDDGADDRDCLNSVKAVPQCVDLIRLMRRCGAFYVGKIEGNEFYKQWTWEPRMSETLVLLSVDPDDSVRQAGKIVLEQVSSARGLVDGLQFLCSSQASILSMFSGLRYAIKMLMGDSIISTSRILHHLFFVVSKLLTPGVSKVRQGFSKCEGRASSCSQGGGFLQNFLYTANSTPIMPRYPSNERNEKAWKKFCELLSENIWPLLLKCLTEGKHLIQEKVYQMAFVRVLEILPLVVGYMSSSQFIRSLFHEVSGNSSTGVSRIVDAKWFYDLIDWGQSQLIVVRRHWKQAVFGILNTMKDFTCGPSLEVISTMETLLASDHVVIDELRNQVSSLSLLMSVKDTSKSQNERHNQLYKYVAEVSSKEDDVVEIVAEVSCKEDDVVEIVERKIEHEVILLSDDEVEIEKECCLSSKSIAESDVQQQRPHEMETRVHSFEKSYDLQSDFQNLKTSTESVSSAASSNLSCPLDATIHSADKHSLKEATVVGDTSDNRGASVPQPGSMNVQAKVSTQLPVLEQISSPFSNIVAEEDVSSQHIQEKNGGFGGALICQRDSRSNVIKDKNDSSDNLTKKLSVQKATHASKAGEALLLKESVADNNYDPLEAALNAAKNKQSFFTKSAVTTKRQLIYLEVPLEYGKGGSERLSSGLKKYKPPRLDEWYKSILELNYFAAVGISLSDTEPENLPIGHLTEVPTSFLSPDHYMNVFRPLVLEEFKAQLRRSFEEISSPEEMCCGTLRQLSLEKIDDFQLVRFMSEGGEDAVSRGCFENDLVLLSQQPFLIVSQNIHMIGKVERRERDTKSRSTILVLRLYLHGGIIRLAKVRRLLTERSKWCVTRLMSITPQLREFQALSAAKDLPLLPIILNPETATLKLAHVQNKAIGVDLKMLPEPLKECLKAAFNESQLKAISAVLDQNVQGNIGLSLIQGPPGTGKTRTILAIVSVFLATSKISTNGMSKNNFSSRNFASSCLPPGKQSVNQSSAIARSWQDAYIARQLMQDADKAVFTTSRMEGQRRARVLVCAQSNAAVDELVSRICKHGLYDSNGQMYKPYIVRVGNAKTVHPDSLPVFIDTLVDQHLGEKKQNEADSQDDEAHNFTAMLRTKLEKLVDKIRLYEDQRSQRQGEQSNRNSTNDDGTCKGADGVPKSEAELKVALNVLYKKKRGICNELAAAEAKEKKAFENKKAIKRDLRRDIIREAEIVVTTLSSCGGDIYSACIESASWNRNGKVAGDALFDAVVIDEAAQALEPATLIPLQLLKPTSGRCVMVGDPKQLPATVLSHVASKFSYECSMFERLQQADYPVTMLSIQYRMNPEICQFPSAHFYDNQLKNGGPPESRLASFHENFHLGPYVFYDVVDGHEESGRSVRSQSLCNESEVTVVLEILRFLKLRYPLEFLPERIGIITPYKQQLTALRLQITKEFGPSIAGAMEFNTVDGFQGREVDIVIFSTVRASLVNTAMSGSKSGGIGFVSDVRRMNVALTRAKISLWIIGNARTLSQSPHWAALLKNTKQRKLLVSVQKPYKAIFCRLQSDSHNKISRATAANVEQSLAQHLYDESKTSSGHKERKQSENDTTKHDSGVLETGLNQMHQGKESSQLGMRGMIETNNHSGISGNLANDRLHIETNEETNLEKHGRLPNDSKDKANENKGEQSEKGKSNSAKRKLNEKNDNKYPSSSAINRTGKSGTKSELENRFSPGRKTKASMSDKSKPQANAISKERNPITEKEKHLLKSKHDRKDAKLDMKSSQLNSGQTKSHETNSGGLLVKKSECVQNLGEFSGNLHGHKKVEDNFNQNTCKSSMDKFLASRKRQREAVDAILPPGAFISSKKRNVSQTASQSKSTLPGNAWNNLAEKLPQSRQVSSDSMDTLSDKSKLQNTQKSDIVYHRKEPPDILSRQDRSGEQDQLSEEWKRFEKALAESKAAGQSSNRMGTGTSQKHYNRRAR